MAVVAGYPITFNAGNAAEIAALGSGATVQNTTVLEGAFSLKQGPSSSMIDNGLNLTTLGVRFLFRCPALPAVDRPIISFAITGALDVLHVYIDSAGKLFVAGANAYGLVTTLSTSTFAINTTYTISVATDTAAGGIVRMWSGSTLEIDVTHGNVKTGIVEFRVSGEATANEYFFDDFYLIDTAELPPLTDAPPFMPIPVVQGMTGAVRRAAHF